MVEIAHTFLFEFVRRGESDRSREENFRKRVSGVKASERVETSWLCESKTDFIVLGPYGFEHGTCEGILARSEVVDFQTMFRVGKDSCDAKSGVGGIADGDELFRYDGAGANGIVVSRRGVSSGTIGTDVHDCAIECSSCCFLSDSVAGVGESSFDDAGSPPRSDVLGWSSSPLNVRSRGRYVNLNSSSVRE